MALVDEPFEHRLRHAAAADTVRRLLHRASQARVRGQDAVADELLLEAQALAAALAQHQQALRDAREQVSELVQAIRCFWEWVGDDRTLHELADDAEALMDLWDALERAQSRLIILAMTGP